MSMESSNWLNNNVLIGFTERRGHAWHYRASEQGAEPNHYPDAIPVEDVYRRLFNFQACDGPILVPDGYDENGQRKWKESKLRKSVYASDNYDELGIVGKDRPNHQFDEWCVRNVENVLDDGLAIGSAGLLQNRAQAWVQIELPDTLRHDSGVEFRPFLTAATSHNATLASILVRGNNLTVCDNTLRLTLTEDGRLEFKVVHSSRSTGRIADAREALQLINRQADEFTAFLDKLTAQTVTDRQWQSILDALVPVKDKDGKELEGVKLTKAENKRAGLNGLWKHDDRVAPWANTGWGVVQAFSTFDQHLGIVRGERAERNQANFLNGMQDGRDRKVLQTLQAVAA